MNKDNIDKSNTPNSSGEYTQTKKVSLVDYDRTRKNALSFLSKRGFDIRNDFVEHSLGYSVLFSDKGHTKPIVVLCEDIELTFKTTRKDKSTFSMSRIEIERLMLSYEAPIGILCSKEDWTPIKFYERIDKIVVPVEDFQDSVDRKKEKIYQLDEHAVKNLVREIYELIDLYSIFPPRKSEDRLVLLEILAIKYFEESSNELSNMPNDTLEYYQKLKELFYDYLEISSATSVDNRPTILVDSDSMRNIWQLLSKFRIKNVDFRIIIKSLWENFDRVFGEYESLLGAIITHNQRILFPYVNDSSEVLVILETLEKKFGESEAKKLIQDNYTFVDSLSNHKSEFKIICYLLNVNLTIIFETINDDFINNDPRFDIIFSFGPDPITDQINDYDKIVGVYLKILKKSGKIILLTPKNFLTKENVIKHNLRKTYGSNLSDIEKISIDAIIESHGVFKFKDTLTIFPLVFVSKSSTNTNTFIGILEDPFYKSSEFYSIMSEFFRFQGSEKFSNSNHSYIVDTRTLLIENFNYRMLRNLSLIHDIENPVRLGDIVDVIVGEKAFDVITSDFQIKIADIGTHDKMPEITNYYGVPDEYEVKENDILFAVRGSTIGKIALANKEQIGRAISPQVVILRIKTKPDPAKSTTPLYLVKILGSKKSQIQIRNAATGVTIPYISANSLKKIIVSLPLPDKQKMKIQETTIIESQIIEHKKSIEHLNEKIKELWE